MRTPNKKLLLGLQALSGGAFGLAVLTIILSIVGFNSEEYFHEDKLGIQFGMSVDATAGEVSVWIQIPKSLFIKATLVNIYKLHRDGVKEPGDLGALFPIGETTYGGGNINIEIYELDDDEMPDLKVRDQSVIPMAYIREESKFPTAIRYTLLGGSFVVKYWRIVKYSIFASAFGLILLGVGLRFKNKRAKVVPVPLDVDIDIG